MYNAPIRISGIVEYGAAGKSFTISEVYVSPILYFRVIKYIIHIDKSLITIYDIISIDLITHNGLGYGAFMHYRFCCGKLSFTFLYRCQYLDASIESPFFSKDEAILYNSKPMKDESFRCSNFTSAAILKHATAFE